MTPRGNVTARAKTETVKTERAAPLKNRSEDRAAVEDFLYREAMLLDDWNLEEWLLLFTPDATYTVPPPDLPDAEGPENTLFVIADDVFRLRDRVTQLLGSQAWAENPRSRTRRQIGNVRVGAGKDGELSVWSNFIVHRIRLGKIDVFIGRYHHVLIPSGDQFMIRRRRAILDLDSLRSVGKVSIIL